jgi:hypothetical protein
MRKPCQLFYSSPSAWALVYGIEFTTRILLDINTILNVSHLKHITWNHNITRFQNILQVNSLT